MGIRRLPSRKLVTAGAIAVTALVTTTGTSAQAATVNLTPAAASTWTGYVTSPTDASRKLLPISPTTTETATMGITVDPSKKAQTWQGVGASLTDSSLALLTNNEAAIKALYDPASTTGARLNLLRLPMSSTDFSTSRWTFAYNTTTKVLTAPAEAVAAANAVNVAKSLRSDLTVIGVPWTAPATMKTTKSTNGGALVAGQEANYAAMLLAQVDWYKSKGIQMKYLAIGNEPGYSNAGYSTMTMTDAQMATIAKNIATPMKNKGVGLLAIDHNWSDRGRVDTALSSAPGAYAGAAFHCYGGSPTQMAGLKVPSIVTECTSSQGDDATYGAAYFGTVLVQNAIDSGSTGLMMWNLALTSTGGPKLTGGCASCRGLLTIDQKTGAVTPNAEFYGMAQLSRAADVGATVIDSDTTANIPVVAFTNPDGTTGVFGVNTYASDQVVSVRVTGGAERRFKVKAGEMFTFRGQAGAVESLLGRLVRTTTGQVAYVDLTGVVHAIGAQSVFDCLGGVTNLVENLPTSSLVGLPTGTYATCALAPVVGAVTGTVGSVVGAVGGTVGAVGTAASPVVSVPTTGGLDVAGLTVPLGTKK